MRLISLLLAATATAIAVANPVDVQTADVADVANVTNNATTSSLELGKGKDKKKEKGKDKKNKKEEKGKNKEDKEDKKGKNKEDKKEEKEKEKGKEKGRGDGASVHCEYWYKFAFHEFHLELRNTPNLIRDTVRLTVERSCTVTGWKMYPEAGPDGYHVKFNCPLFAQRRVAKALKKAYGNLAHVDGCDSDLPWTKNRNLVEEAGEIQQSGKSEMSQSDKH